MKNETAVNRLEWVDFARACVIILAIIGHCVGYDDGGSLLRGAIFSFHMPMFFFLSAVTMTFSSGREEFVRRVKKGARHLLIPVLIVWILCMIRGLIVGYITFAQWKEQLFSLLFASGTDVEFAGMEIPALGMPWFLVSLFTVRVIFDYLHRKLPESLLFVVSMLCGIIGVVVGTQQSLAFSLDVSLAAMPFFYFGYRYGCRIRGVESDAGIRGRSIDPGGEEGAESTVRAGRAGRPGRRAGLWQLIWPVIWIVTLFFTFPDVKQWTYLELSIRRYSLFPVSYLCAFAGIMMVIAFSVLCCRTRYVKIPMLFIGKNSLYLYMIHMVDSYWYPLYEIEGRQFVTALARVCVDLAILVIVLLVVKGIRMVLMKKPKGC